MKTRKNIYFKVVALAAIAILQRRVVCIVVSLLRVCLVLDLRGLRALTLLRLCHPIGMKWHLKALGHLGKIST